MRWLFWRGALGEGFGGREERLSRDIGTTLCQPQGSSKRDYRCSDADPTAPNRIGDRGQLLLQSRFSICLSDREHVSTSILTSPKTLGTLLSPLSASYLLTIILHLALPSGNESTSLFRE